jgi:hypothetical protein
LGSNISTKALLEEEKRISKRMEAMGIGFPSQHVDAYRLRLAALEAPVALVLNHGQIGHVGGVCIRQL